MNRLFPGDLFQKLLAKIVQAFKFPSEGQGTGVKDSVPSDPCKLLFPQGELKPAEIPFPMAF